MATKELKYFDEKVSLSRGGRMRLVGLMTFFLFSPGSM